MQTTHATDVVLKEDLLRPELLAAAGSRGATLVETHTSWVLVLERDVFKVKRPVYLGFLDFRTKEQRKVACEAELRLNARLAPHVYLGLVPIRRSRGGNATIGGHGTIVDWAVHMVRLPEEIRADTLLASGALSGEALDRVAARIADFHAVARCDAETARFGAPAVVAQNVEENFAQARSALPRYLGPGEADQLVAWQRAFLTNHATLFEARAESGHVRDGHGDLRLEHVYFEPGDRVTVLDCIEFADRFRFADVCADVAFLSMDLAGHGRVDLAERFLAAYARATNDFELYTVVDFYESYRAFVRGKISAMLAEDASVDASTRERAAASARTYFLLALSADRKSLLQPAVVAVGGIIASGKSTVAERIAQELGAPVIDADRTRKAMIGVEATRKLQDPAWSGAYDPTFTEKVYQAVLRHADAVLDSGRPVVLDASFRSPGMRDSARKLARFHGVPFHFLECVAPREVCRSRLAVRERGTGVSDGRLEIFDDFCARYEPVRELDPAEHTVVDTTRSIEENVAALRSVVPMWPPGLRG